MKKFFSYYYRVTACHMVVISSDGKVKFYQAKGYTARQESAKNLLRGKSYVEKGPEVSEPDLSNIHITEIHPR